MSDTPEAVAFRLLEMLMQNEAQVAELKTKTTAMSRNWILNVYAECLLATSGQRRPTENKGRWGRGGGGGGGKGGARQAAERAAAGGVGRSRKPDPSIWPGGVSPLGRTFRRLNSGCVAIPMTAKATSPPLAAAGHRSCRAGAEREPG